MNIFEPPPGGDVDATGLGPLAAPMQTIRGFGVWKDFVHDHFPWLELHNRSNDEFTAEVGSQRIESSVLTSMRLGASEVHRTRRLANAAEVGQIKIMVQIAGRLELEQDRRSCLILPGQVTVCDTARPYRISIAERSHLAVLMLPYSACPGWEHISQRVCGAALRDALTVRSALAALATAEGSSDREARSTVHRAAQWMLSAALSRSASAPELSALQGTRLARIEHCIEQRLDDPTLDADALAAALCMSRRALYTLFQQYRTTPARLIQDLRLQHSKLALADPAQRRRKITDIAFDFGFNDYATFSRLFKQRHGLTPRDYRAAALEPRH